ncbi:MAG: hypothetical protein KC589_00545 [Nanoarchaeota archaeon]|nr:hypothetical protein [Nanoarchaeota archaeon]
MSELKKLNLPKGKYTIVGSGPIAIRNIRDNTDIDILITKELWFELFESGNFKRTLVGELKLSEHVFAYYDWWCAPVTTEEMIKSSDFIDGFFFVSLEHFVAFKKKMARFKDLFDIRLLENLGLIEV